MKKIKVCHITVSHTMFDTRIFKKECISLAKEGYDVTLIAPGKNNCKKEGVKVLAIPQWNNFFERVYTIPIKVMNIASRINADIYHFHDPELLIYMGLFNINKKRKIIWDAHENYGVTIYKLNSLKIKFISFVGSYIFSFLELLFSKIFFSGVVTITNKMGKKYKKIGINTCILANYAIKNDFNYKGKSKLSIKPRLISSGLHFRGRGIINIAKSYKYIKKLTDSQIYFVGRFSSDNLKENVIKILELNDPHLINCRVIGDVSYDFLINKAIPKAWAAAVLFDTSDPNNRNGLPNRLFECLANGVPVITTDGTETARFVKKYNLGIVISNNEPNLIAKSFIKIASDINYRNTLSENAYKFVSEKYNWEKDFENLKLFYSKLL